MRRLIALILGALAIAGCDGAPPPVAEGEPRPALWEVRNAQGALEGWLFGTIHALPSEIAWRSPRLETALRGADSLVVEVANLEDDAAMSAIFRELAFDRPQGPLVQRVSPALRDHLATLFSKGKTAPSSFDNMESWAAALALAQLAQDGGRENGVDRVLIASFTGRRVIELEGARMQLAIFDRLPEKEQRDLLDAVIVEASANDNSDSTMAEDWSRGDIESLARNTEKGILADPELRAALLVDRNRAWTTKLQAHFASNPETFVAVGAGHLLGEDSVTGMLEDLGYTIRRVE